MAEAITNDAFLAWAASVSLGFDPQYPDARSFGLLEDQSSSRFWLLPSCFSQWPKFTASLLEGLDPWNSGYLWPRSGTWPEAAQSSSCQEQVRDVVLQGAGIPDGWNGPIRYSHREGPTVLAVLFVYLAFGWCGDDDLYFVPDHGRQVMQASHHDVIHITCEDESRIGAFVEHMEVAGYQLPDEPPDETFKWPYWMPKK